MRFASVCRAKIVTDEGKKQWKAEHFGPFQLGHEQTMLAEQVATWQIQYTDSFSVLVSVLLALLFLSDQISACTSTSSLLQAWHAHFAVGVFAHKTTW